MPPGYKGFSSLYSFVLNELWETSFYEWKLDKKNELEAGQICQAFVPYMKDKQYFLNAAKYDPLAEEETLWKLEEARTRQPLTSEFRLQGFDLERNEYFIVNRAKLRFVVLLKPAGSNWVTPINPMDSKDLWLVLPLFTYKERHSQKLVINDQGLNQEDRFYFPPATEVSNRLNESAALFSFIQPVPSNSIFPITAMCPEKGMQKGFKVSKFVLKLIIYHYFSNMGIMNPLFGDGQDLKDEYAVFKELVNELIESNLKKATI